MICNIWEKEKALVGALGANVSLGGFRVWIEKAGRTIHEVMPFFNDFLVIAQVAVALATLVYIILKIRKVLRKTE